MRCLSRISSAARRSVETAKSLTLWPDVAAASSILALTSLRSRKSRRASFVGLVTWVPPFGLVGSLVSLTYGLCAYSLLSIEPLDMHLCRKYGSMVLSPEPIPMIPDCTENCHTDSRGESEAALAEGEDRIRKGVGRPGEDEAGDERQRGERMRVRQAQERLPLGARDGVRVDVRHVAPIDP